MTEGTALGVYDGIIRRAREEDVPKIVRLEKSCFSDAWSEQSVKGTLSSLSGYLLIAETGLDAAGKEADALPLGYLAAQIVGDEGELLRIAAAPDRRRRGTGQRLLAQMIKDHPSVRIWRLDVRTQNAAAIALYEKNGFRIVTENPDVYRDPKDNGYLMIRGQAE